MGAAYDFLNLYKELEDLLEAKYAQRRDTRRGSVILEFMNSTEGEPYRERLNLCREIRNLMTHNADLDGEPVVVPSGAVMDSLKEILQAVRQPRPALDFATKRSELLIAQYGDAVLPLMKRMEEKGFSHVPVLNRNGSVAGVFSVSTIFSAGLRAGSSLLNEETRIRDFEPFLPVERHICEQFRFVRADAAIPEAAEAFETRGGERKKRVAAVFLTDGGDEKGCLQGMITPWDLIGQKSRG